MHILSLMTQQDTVVGRIKRPFLYIFIILVYFSSVYY